MSIDRRGFFKGLAGAAGAAVVGRSVAEIDIPITAPIGKPVECWVTACPFPIGRAGPFGWEVTPEAKAAGFTLDDVLNSR